MCIFVKQFGKLPEPVRALEKAVVQKEKIEILPNREDCAQPGENCIWTKENCCQVPGHRCYLMSQFIGFCNATCTPGKDVSKCDQLPASIHLAPVVYTPGTSMFCFSVFTFNTGSTKRNWELDLLRTQFRSGASIFGCGSWDVYSDVEVRLSPGPPIRFYTKKVLDFEGEFHKFWRENGNGWVNTPMFYMIWKRMRTDGRWQHKDWTVKVACDAVFLPQRLVGHLATQVVTEHGIYFENCKDVDSDFFGGSLEVYSNKAFAVFLANLEDCKLNLCWKGGCGWKWGPWGEDLFAQRCMDRFHVEKIQDFGLTTDGACPADRPKDQRMNKKWKPDCANTLTPAMHPFKKPSDYFNCLGAIMKS